MPKFQLKTFKTILNKKKYLDTWFWDRYTLNPFQGCQFGCIYCDARSAKYHLPSDFETQITVKNGSAAMLARRLQKARRLTPDVVGIGGTTDAYQPAEKKYGLTRAILAVLAEYGFPVHIPTKSHLVTRDTNLLNAIGKDTWCSVSFSIPALDESSARLLDHHAPSPKQRLAALRHLKSHCPYVQAGVLLIPMIPGIGDDADSLETLVAEVKAAGADYLLFGGGLSMQRGNAEWFLDRLAKQRPLLMPHYESLYGFRYQSGAYHGRQAPPNSYLIPKYKLLLELCQHYKLPIRIPRYLPRDHRRINYQIAEVLFRQAYLEKMHGHSGAQWFWAGHRIQDAAKSIADLWDMGLLPHALDLPETVFGAVKKQLEQIKNPH